MTAQNKAKKSYRYRDTHWEGTTEIRLNVFEIVRHTPKGFWIHDLFLKKKWVAYEAFKGYCRINPDEAWEDFVHRKKKHVNILRNQIERVENVLLHAYRNEEAGKREGPISRDRPLGTDSLLKEIS